MEVEEQSPGHYQSLVDHLIELRVRVLWSFLFVFIGFLISWFFSDQIFDFIRAPIAPYLKSASGGLVFTAPMDKFLAYIKVSLLSGVVIASPLWIHQIWIFITPGLYQREKRMGLAFMSAATFLFLTGVCFVYFVVYPMAFKFLMTFGSPTDIPMITISEYISFFITTTLVFGFAFEMPVIFTVLGMLGLIRHDFLSSKRRYAIVILAALSAILTPPDVISMVLMLCPLLLLYELSIVLVKTFAPKPAT